MSSKYDLLTRNSTDADDDYGIQTLGERTSALTSCPSSMALAQSPEANHSCRHFSNSHHAQVRRSTDDREEDLLLDQIEELSESANSSEQHNRTAPLRSRTPRQQEFCTIHRAQNGELVSSTRRPESKDTQRFCSKWKSNIIACASSTI